MSATTTRPAWKRPGATASPTLAPWNVTVTSARTAAPATSPVEASTPEGRSTESTGRPLSSIRSMSAAASGRGAPWKPVPNSASTTTSAPARSSVSSRVAPRLAEEARGDPPVAAVRAAAAHDGEAPCVGEGAQRLGGDGGAARSISSSAVPG